MALSITFYVILGICLVTELAGLWFYLLDEDEEMRMIGLLLAILSAPPLGASLWIVFATI